MTLGWAGIFSSFGSLGKLGITIGCAVLPLFYAKVLQDNKIMFKVEGVKERIGSLFVGIRSRSLSARMFTVFFLIRRFSFAVALTLLKD